MVSKLVIEQDFHPQTVAELQILRDIRLALAKKQLAQIDATLDQLVSRNLIREDERHLARKDLEIELIERIHSLEQRDSEMEEIHSDEIALYVDII